MPLWKWYQSTSTLEKLNGSLVLLGGLPRREGAKVVPLIGLWILLLRIKAILAGLELSNHHVSFLV
jgi:hypothetical protein